MLDVAVGALSPRPRSAPGWSITSILGGTQLVGAGSAMTGVFASVATLRTQGRGAATEATATEFPSIPDLIGLTALVVAAARGCLIITHAPQSASISPSAALIESGPSPIACVVSVPSGDVFAELRPAVTRSIAPLVEGPISRPAIAVVDRTYLDVAAIVRSDSGAVARSDVAIRGAIKTTPHAIDSLGVAWVSGIDPLQPFTKARSLLRPVISHFALFDVVTASPVAAVVPGSRPGAIIFWSVFHGSSVSSVVLWGCCCGGSLTVVEVPPTEAQPTATPAVWMVQFPYRASAIRSAASNCANCAALLLVVPLHPHPRLPRVYSVSSVPGRPSGTDSHFGHSRSFRFRPHVTDCVIRRVDYRSVEVRPVSVCGNPQSSALEQRRWPLLHLDVVVYQACARIEGILFSHPPLGP